MVGSTSKDKQNRTFHSFDEVQACVLDLDNYRFCRMRAYNMWACILSQETNVQVKNCFLRLNDNIDTVTVLDKNNPVLIRGCKGAKENIAISYDRFFSDFRTRSGERITPEYLRKAMGDTGKLQWTKVAYKPEKVAYLAMCIPDNFTGVLRIGRKCLPVNVNSRPNEKVSGDFIVCPVVDGHSDIMSAFIMRGDLFVELFQQYAWRGYVKGKIEKSVNYTPIVRKAYEKEIILYSTVADVVRGLFAPSISDTNLKSILIKLRRMQDTQSEQLTALLYDLNSLVKSAGSKRLLHIAFSLWRQYRKKLSDLLRKSGIHRGLSLCLGCTSMVGQLELFTYVDESVALGFVFDLYDGDNINSSKYAFKCINLLTCTNKYTVAGNDTIIMPMTDDAREILATVNYTANVDEYNMGLASVISLIRKYGVKALEGLHHELDDCTNKLYTCWAELLHCVPIPEEQLTFNKVTAAENFVLSSGVDLREAPRDGVMTYVQTIMECLQEDDSQLWGYGILPLAVGDPRYNTLTMQHLKKNQKMWWLMFFAYDKQNRGQQPRVALLAYSLVSGRLTGRKRYLDADDLPWNHKWNEYWYKLYQDKAIPLEINKHAIKRYLLE